MYLTLICVGKLAQKHWQSANDTYLKYLRPYHQVTIREMADEKDPKQASPAAIAQILQAEGDRILKALPASGPVICLDVQGRLMTTEDMAGHFKRFESQGQSQATFVIGGSYGIDPRVKARAQALWSLSPLTFPHQVARILLLEQILRCAKINQGHLYHK